MNVIVHNWQKNKFEFSDGSPVPPTPATLHTLKWMPGDVVSSGDLSVVKRICGRVVGIVDILNRTRFGTNPRGVPLYIMHPIDVAYPPFLVAIKTKPATNILVVVKYEHWDGIWPRAGMDTLIGCVGDLKSELDAMKKTLHPACSYDSSQFPEAAEAAAAAAAKHARFDWDVVLHIDPPGCKDVDDVICWKRRGDRIQFSIGIADVAHWIPEGSDVDTCAYQRGATLYQDGKVIEPMLPSDISESSASLRCDNIERPAVCLTFELVYDEGRWRRCCTGRWELHMVRVSESYTYESILDKERAKEVREYLSAVCECDLGHDSHEWIEHAMILYNRSVGEELMRAGVGLLRTHAGTTNEEYKALAVKTGCKDIEWLGSAAGKYVDSKNNTGHCGLNLTCYTHASSPLRRYVDLLNQRWIRALYFGFPPPKSAGAYEYNMCSKRIRRIERNMHFLTCVLSLSRSEELPSAHGFLIDTKTCHGIEKWKVYVPEWKRVVSCGVKDESGTKGACVRVRMYLDVRQGDWNRRFIYQAGVGKAPPL